MRPDLLKSPERRLADQLLNRPVEHWIAEMRADGMSWLAIAQALFLATGGRVQPDEGRLREWLGDDVFAAGQLAGGG